MRSSKTGSSTISWAKATPMMEPLETSTALSFHGVAYVVTVSVRNQTLDLQVEVDDRPAGASSSPAQSSELPACWTAQFPAAYVEDLTRKTGNYKRFPVFVNMLLSAMTHRSDAVFIDLLTTADLELYRKRKLGRQGQRLNDSFDSFSGDKSTAAAQNASKRYLILTYAVEFDRVHYPLPLTLVEKPTIEILQRTIRRLRHTIKQASEGGKTKLMEEEMRTLKEENRCLKATLKTYCDREEGDENAPASGNIARVPGVPSTGIDLQHELELSMKENKELISIYQQLREDSSAEMARLRAEIKQLKVNGIESNEQETERERLETRRRLNDSNAAAHEALLQLQEMKLKMDEVQLKNRELQRQLAIARAKVANTGTAATRQVTSNGPRERVQPQRGVRRPHTRDYVDSSDDEGSQGYRSTGGTTRPQRRSFRRFDPTAYEEERQRKLQQRNATQRGASPSPRSRRPPTSGGGGGGYTSDSSAGGYSSAGSDVSKASSRGRSRGGYQQQRQADARLASPRREPPPSPRTGAAKPPPAPSRGRSPSPARGAPPPQQVPTPDPAQRRRPGYTTASTGTNTAPAPAKTKPVAKKLQRPPSLLADTSLDSFSDIDDRLTALQQFLKEAKQATGSTTKDTTV